MARNINGSDYGRDLYASGSQNVGRYQNVRQIARDLYPWRSRDVVYLMDDFIDDTINLDLWTESKDTNATSYAINAQQGGVIRATAGNSDGEGIGLYGAAIWSGDKNCGMEVRFKLNVITNVRHEIGFADTATDFKDPILNDIDTPTLTNGAGDAALIGRDTAQTLTTCALVTVGSTPYAAQKSNLGTYAPTAATFVTMRVQLVGDNVFGFVWEDNLLKSSTSIALGIEGGTAVRPYVNVTRVSTADKIIDIDYLRVWQDRYSA